MIRWRIIFLISLDYNLNKDDIVQTKSDKTFVYPCSLSLDGLPYEHFDYIYDCMLAEIGLFALLLLTWFSFDDFCLLCFGFAQSATNFIVNKSQYSLLLNTIDENRFNQLFQVFLTRDQYYSNVIFDLNFLLDTGPQCCYFVPQFASILTPLSLHLGHFLLPSRNFALRRANILLAA